jgi:hypothetical protein
MSGETLGAAESGNHLRTLEFLTLKTQMETTQWVEKKQAPSAWRATGAASSVRWVTQMNGLWSTTAQQTETKATTQAQKENNNSDEFWAWEMQFWKRHHLILSLGEETRILPLAIVP